MKLEELLTTICWRLKQCILTDLHCLVNDLTYTYVLGNRAFLSFLAIETLHASIYDIHRCVMVTVLDFGVKGSNVGTH